MTSAVVLSQPQFQPGQLGWNWKIILGLWFLIASFLPATLTPKFAFWDIPIAGYDVALLAETLLCFAVYFGTTTEEEKPANWHRHLHWWFAGMIIYAAFSLEWSGLDRSNFLAMLFTLLMAAASFFLAYFVVASLSPEKLRSLLLLGSYAIAAAGTVYALQSFFSIGLRSELGTFYSVGFGIERVKGPLFDASTGHIVLLPAAAFLTQEIALVRSGRMLKFCAAIVLVITILGLGSRAAAGLLAVSALGVILVARGIPHRKLIAICLLAGIAIAAGVVYAYADIDRLYSFADPRRLATHMTALYAVSNRGFIANLTGSGYGSFWPWYLPDVELTDLISRGADMRLLEYGQTLYHPHSLLLVLVVELGFAGLLFFAKVWSVLASLVTGAWNGANYGIFNIVVAVTSVAMFADLIVFKNPKVTAIWWLYVLAALAMSGRPKNAEAAQ